MFWKGIVLGFSVAAPVGPIGLLCIRRSLVHGRRAGFVSGMGAATADLLYGILAATGVVAVSAYVAEPLRIIGGLFLCYLGVKALRDKRTARPAEGSGFFSTFVLTLTNPMTILSFVGMFAGMGLTSGGGALPLAAGVFAGSAVWWLLLSSVAGALRDRMADGAMVWLNRATAAVLLGFGAAALIR